jgi:NAD(P)-dependent dehydrogenase (short-subunit alcohol dehydrogenase family)
MTADTQQDAKGCAVVTGAARGIGAASALALAGEGWPVVVNYRNDGDGAADVVERIQREGASSARAAARRPFGPT